MSKGDPRTRADGGTNSKSKSSPKEVRMGSGLLSESDTLSKRGRLW